MDACVINNVFTLGFLEHYRVLNNINQNRCSIIHWNIFKILHNIHQNYNIFKGIAPLQMTKCHVFVLMQIRYPYIVWNHFPKFHENRASSF